MTHREPKLADLIGDGSRGEGFEQFSMMVADAIQLFDSKGSPEQAAQLHMMKLFLVAAVEGARATEGKLDRVLVLPLIAAASGYAAFAAAASVLTDEFYEKPKRAEKVFGLLERKFRLGMEEAHRTIKRGKP